MNSENTPETVRNDMLRAIGGADRPTTVELLPFFNETDILQARIRLMAGHDVCHVVAEGNLTHQGAPKPWYLDGIPLDGPVARHRLHLPDGTGDDANWERERFQRDWLVQVLSVAPPDELVISADIDEIIDPDALDRIRSATLHGPVALGMRMIYYGNREHTAPWPAAKAFRARDMPESLSTLRLSQCPLIRDCGWHLSYLGDTARRRRKVEAFAHAENRPGSQAWARVEAGEYGPNGEPLVPFNPDELPEPLRGLVR